MKKSKPSQQPTPAPENARRAGVPVPVVLVLIGAALGVGLILNQGRDPQSGPRSGPSGGLPVTGTSPGGKTDPGKVALTPPGTPPAAGAGTPPNAPPQGTNGAPAPNGTAPAPPAPPPAQKLPPYNPPSLGSGKQGEGEVVDFYDGIDPKEKAKYEEARRKAWEERLKEENDRLVTLMESRLGLTASQVGQVKQILDDQTKARQELIKGLVNGSIPRVEMEDRVKAIKAQTEERLKGSFTEGQWTNYQKLDPKDQPTATDTANPR